MSDLAEERSTAILQKRQAASNYNLDNFNAVNFTIFNLSEPNWEVG
jgi:hypothetical protein